MNRVFNFYRMYKKWIFIIVIFILVSCDSNRKKLPEGVIGETQMVEIFTEIELGQAFVKLKMSELDSINQEALFQHIFDRYSISQEKFNESLKYYVTEPEVLEDIYGQVIVKLSERQAETQRIEESEKDSID